MRIAEAFEERDLNQLLCCVFGRGPNQPWSLTINQRRHVTELKAVPERAKCQEHIDAVKEAYLEAHH